MNFGNLAESIWQQIETVWDAPVPFLAVILFVGFIIWRVVQREYANRLADASSSLDLANARVLDYERKLSGASPDQAREQIERLEARLSLLEPRKLSAEQRSGMTRVLARTPAHISISSDMRCTDAPYLSAALTAAFHDAGWSIDNPMVVGLPYPPVSGLGVRVADPSHPSEIEQLVIQAFREAGLDFDLQKSAPRSHNKQNPLEIVISAIARSS